MKLEALDLAIVAVYLLAMAWVGFWVKKKATRGLDAYFLADRGLPWWMLGLSGCSSYIDIGGTMSMVGLLYYVGMKGLWATHIFWGWFIICFYMAFQAKWIRRSGVMTFAQWNETRFGKGRDTEGARIAAGIFLLVLMVSNLTFISVGTGKFGEEVLGLDRWKAELIIFSVTGVYVTLGGFFGVIYTDILQTVLIFVGAAIFAFMAFDSGESAQFLASRPGGWGDLAPAWTLWPSYLKETPAAYQHFNLLGPVLISGSLWCIFRVLAGPNVWDFQFFLTARSPRDASMAAGLWTVGYTARWILACSFMVLSFQFLGSGADVADAEKIMPLVLGKLSVGLRGFVVAILLAALMSTLTAMINVTSSVVVNDFLKRYFTRSLPEAKLVRMGQLASVLALLAGFGMSRAFRDVVTIWETMIFAVVTVILVPATLRWHWWRFGARAFTTSMAGSTVFILGRLLLFKRLPSHVSLAVDVTGCIIITLVLAFLTKPADMEVLVRFYTGVRPFGFWGPVREEAVRRGLVPARDPMAAIDMTNGFLTAVFQFSLAAIPFCALLQLWRSAILWTACAALLAAVLYFTWYRNLPAREEEAPSPVPAEPPVPAPAGD